jgi:hypothetical protein
MDQYVKTAKQNLFKVITETDISLKPVSASIGERTEAL